MHAQIVRKHARACDAGARRALECPPQVRELFFLPRARRIQRARRHARGAPDDGLWRRNCMAMQFWPDFTCLSGHTGRRTRCPPSFRLPVQQCAATVRVRQAPPAVCGIRAPDDANWWLGRRGRTCVCKGTRPAKRAFLLVWGQGTWNGVRARPSRWRGGHRGCASNGACPRPSPRPIQPESLLRRVVLLEWAPCDCASFDRQATMQRRAAWACRWQQCASPARLELP